jgi:hypothetical protein
MKWFAIVFVLPAIQAAAQDNAQADRLVAGGIVRPPVLRNADLNDSLVLTLPGASVPLAAKVSPPERPPAAAPTADRPTDATGGEPDHRPVLRRAPRPVLPAEFEKDSAAFCQKLIGAWTEPDAYNLFGEPLRSRPAVGDDGVANGRVIAYSDPTGRYREVELDFDKDTGALRTVFVYPWKLSWDQCRRQWGGNVQFTTANKGRRFYSYVDRRLDVLVDPGGNVISLGLY